MNEAIKNLNFNLTAEEAIKILGAPLHSTNKNDIKILVYSSLTDKKADVLYFVDDRLKVKSLSNFSQQELLTGLGDKQVELYFLQADDRGTANDQWLRFYANDGLATISESKLSEGLVQRIVYFESMDIAQFTKIWGGAKFIKREEEPVTEISNVGVSEEKATESLIFGIKEPTILIVGISTTLVLILLVVIFVVFRLNKKNKKGLDSVKSLPTSAPLNQPPLV